MSKVRVKKVSMIILMQSNLAAGVDFYQKLGLKLLFHLKDKWAEFGLHGVNIGLCPTSIQAPEEGIRTGLVLEVEDLQAVYEAWRNEMTFIREPKEALHGIMASIKDPSGNIVDLYQPTPEKLRELIEKTVETGDEHNCKDKKSQNKGCCKGTSTCAQS